MIKIDKGIPIPTTKQSRDSKYPFKTMEIGDSFYAEGAVQLTGAYNIKFRPKHFIQRKEGTGTRVWRDK